MCWLIFPISDFEGLISRYVGLVVKFGLWSLIVMKAGCSAREFILWSMFNLVVISLASLFMLFIVVSGAFLYVCFTLFDVSFL